MPPSSSRGESGSGKEIVAHGIHAQSGRARRNFVPVNCAAIPHELLESEMFGHERGAFTGAAAPRHGLFAIRSRAKARSDAPTSPASHLGSNSPHVTSFLLTLNCF